MNNSLLRCKLSKIKRHFLKGWRFFSFGKVYYIQYYYINILNQLCYCISKYIIFLMNEEDPTICLSYGVQLSIKHIFTEYFTYEVLRKKTNLSEHNISTSLNNSPDATKSIVYFIIITKLMN